MIEFHTDLHIHTNSICRGMASQPKTSTVIFRIQAGWRLMFSGKLQEATERFRIGIEVQRVGRTTFVRQNLSSRDSSVNTSTELNYLQFVFTFLRCKTMRQSGALEREPSK